MADTVPRTSPGRGHDAPVATRVVAALDGSTLQSPVTTWAASYAARRGVPLELVHVVEVGFSATPYDVLVTQARSYVDEIEAAARERLDRIAAGLRERHHGLTVTVHTPIGSPAAALVRLSQDALLVVGASTRGTLERFVLGSTALAAVAHAHGTVVVVPEELPPVEPRRVVVGADGSEPSTRALEHAVAEAATVGGKVTAVMAWTVEVDEGVVVTEPGSERWTRIESRLRDVLAHPVQEARAAHPEVPVDIVVRHGSPSSVLLQVADEVDAELVVVGRRGRGGFAGLLMGSVSRTVAQRSTRPVAVVR